MATDDASRMSVGRHTLGIALRTKRQERGLTLPALSDASGISTSYLSDIERGRTAPTLERLDACAQALGSTVCDLLQGLYPWDTDVIPDGVGPPPDGRRGL